jgi:putative dehydrogenase
VLILAFLFSNLTGNGFYRLGRVELNVNILRYSSATEAPESAVCRIIDQRRAMALKNVGMIGLGIMGSAMSANLIKAGFRVVGFDVLPERRQDHKKMGGTPARSCSEVANRSPIIVTSLPSSEALLDTAAALKHSSRPNQVVIETSTLPIPVKEEAQRILAARGVTLLDSPLSGTGAQARAKDLIVYASGDPEAYQRTAPVLEAFARAHYYIGAFGTGSKMKFVANLLVAIHNVAAAEAIVLAMKAGLDPAMVLEVISDGAGNSRMLEVRGPMMVRGEYSEATMKVQVWQKDMTTIGDFARKLECPTPLLSACAPVYTAAMAMGLGSADTASVCAVLEQMANHSRSPAGRKDRLRAH